MFTAAGIYELAVTCTDPVTGELLQISSFGVSERLRIVPGGLDPARTLITDQPTSLTAGEYHTLHSPISNLAVDGISGTQFGLFISVYYHLQSGCMDPNSC